MQCSVVSLHCKIFLRTVARGKACNLYAKSPGGLQACRGIYLYVLLVQAVHIGLGIRVSDPLAYGSLVEFLLLCGQKLF